MSLGRAQNAREDAPGEVGDWRQPPLFGSVPALHGSQLPPRAPRTGEWASVQTPSNLNSPSMHSPFQWGQPRGVVRPQGLYLPGQSPPVPLFSQSQQVSQPPQVHQRRPSAGFSSLQNLQGIQQWLDRATLANEKAKSVFSVVSEACHSTDCSTSDVHRLISISFEQLVRNLDYMAAAKALKATTIQERQWSTEPNGQGFRMAGKEAKGYIDKNNIDPMRLIYSVTDEGLCESRPVHAVAEESVIEQQRASWYRQTAKDAATMADIPLYTELDNFLEQAECQYAIDGEKAVSSGHPRPAVVPQSNQAQDGTEVPAEETPAGPPLHVQGHQHTNEGIHLPSSPQGNGDLPPILVKEGYLVSTGTFDRRSHNTWNDLSPRYDGGITNLPWCGHEEILLSAPTMAAMARDVMDDFNLPGDGTLIRDPQPAKSVSSTKDGDGQEAAGATAGDSRNPASKETAGKTPHSVPSCFCGDTCERKGSAGCMAYFACKHSKCPAHIPIADASIPISTNDDSGTLIKVTSEATENPSKKKRKGASSPAANPGGAGAVAKKKGSAEDSTKASTKANSRVNSKAKSRAKASPKRKRKGDNEIASSPDGPLSPVRRLSRSRSGPNASSYRHIEAVGPRLHSTNRETPLSPKAKSPPCRPPLAAAAGSPTKGLSMDEDVAQSLDQMIQEELASLPKEMRCKKPDPYGQGRVCLTSLRPGIGGAGPLKHLGRCRYKPRNAGHIFNGISRGPPAFGGSKTSVPPKSSAAGRAIGKTTLGVPHPRRAADNAGNVESSEESHGRTSPGDVAASHDDPTELIDTRAASEPANGPGIELDTAHSPGPSCTPPPALAISGPTVDTEKTQDNGEAPQSEVARDGREEGIALAAGTGGAEEVMMAVDDVATARDNSGKRLSESIKSGKSHWDGQGVLHREFVTLSAKKIAASYGCSSVLPHSAWNEQKRQFVLQCKALQTHPMLHATIIGNTDVGRCDVNPEDPKDAESLAYMEEATGVFAREHIKAGCPVAELIGETVSVAEAKRREVEYTSLIASGGLALTNIVGDNRGHLHQARDLMFNLNGNWVLDATKVGSSARFARRTKEGNCRLTVVEDPAGAMHVYLQAISDLSKDEEITIQSV